MDKEIILNFGDSQGEIWDYVFFANDNYIKYNDNNNIPFKIKYNNWKFDFMYPHIRRPLLD